MADLGSQILQQRQELETAKQQAQAEAKKLRMPRRSTLWQLKNKEQALSGKVQSQAQKRKALGRSMIAGIMQQEEAFETEVAEQATEYAKPEYLERAYSKAKEKIAPSIAGIKARIKEREDRVASILAKKELTSSDREKIEQQEAWIREDKARLGVYESQMGDKIGFTKGAFSGELQLRSQYAGDVEMSYNLNVQQQQQLAKSLGVSRTELDKKFKEVEMGVSITETFTEPQILKLEQAKVIRYEKVPEKKVEAGGYFINPITGLGYSSNVDMPGLTKTATMSEVRGGAVLQKDNVFFGKESVGGFSFESKQPKFDAFGLGTSTPTSNLFDVESKKNIPRGGDTFAQIRQIEGATFTPTFTGSIVDIDSNLTSSQEYNIKKYRDIYGDSNLYSSPTLWGNIKSSFGDLFGVNKGGKTEWQLQQELISTKQVVAPSGVQGTLMTVPKDTSELSTEAQLYSFGLSESMKAQLSVESKKQKILDIISPGGITEEEATAANIALGNISAYEGAKINKDVISEQKRISELGSIKSWKEFAPNLFAQEDWLYKKGVKPWAIKTALTTESFGVGLYEGVRNQPKKALVSAGIAIGVTAATWGLGAGATAAGYASVARGIGTTSRLVGYGMGTLYGASVVGRTWFTPGLYEKGKVLGEITSTELLPGYLGYKMTSKGIRIGSLKYDQYKVLQGESELLGKYKFSKTELAAIKKEYLLSKAFQSTQPPTKELSFEGMKRIPAKAQKPLMDFLQTYKRSLVVGGSSAQRTQLTTAERRAPGDIDIFVEGPFANIRSKLYAKRLATQLKASGVKVKLNKAAIKIGGEKAVEFHSYKDFLRGNIEQAMPWYKSIVSSKLGVTRTPSGIKVLKLGVQGTQKVLGYARYGKPRTKDILDWREAIQPSLQKQIVTELGPKIKYVDYIKVGGVSPGTKVGGMVSRTPTQFLTGEVLKVQIKRTTKPEVLTHELVHVKKPFWSERKVGEATIMSSEVDKKGFFIEGTTAGYSQTRFETSIPYYKTTTKTSPIVYKPSIYKPTRVVTPSYTPKITKAIPTPKTSPYKPTSYKPTRVPTPRVKSPYKPTSYKPTGIITPPIITEGKYKYKPIRQKKEGAYLKLKFGEKYKKTKERLQEPYRYTPSIAASILDIRARTKPFNVGGKNTYFAGFRPLITKSDKKVRLKLF